MLWWRPLASSCAGKSNKSREGQVTVGAAILTALFAAASKQEHCGSEIRSPFARHYTPRAGFPKYPKTRFVEIKRDGV
eukprot:scaffold59876_cov42-Phaeocystis_antarctica.AAC.1